MVHARPDYNRIQDPAGLIGKDEPVFLTRAQDELFIPLLEWYALEYKKRYPYVGDPKVTGTLRDHVTRAENWQSNHETKMADLAEPPALKQAIRLRSELLALATNLEDIASQLQGLFTSEVQRRELKEVPE